MRLTYVCSEGRKGEKIRQEQPQEEQHKYILTEILKVTY